LVAGILCHCGTERFSPTVSHWRVWRGSTWQRALRSATNHFRLRGVATLPCCSVRTVGTNWRLKSLHRIGATRAFVQSGHEYVQDERAAMHNAELERGSGSCAVFSNIAQAPTHPGGFIVDSDRAGRLRYAGTPPLPSVTVLLEPNSAVVSLGQTQQFQALVTGSADTAVMWEVNGIMNGNAISGTVSITGLYTAPMAMPNPAAVTVTAVSQANPHDLASAVITLQDGIAISVLPATATVAPGGAQVFAASISGAGSVAGRRHMERERNSRRAGTATGPGGLRSGVTPDT
jgi:hypothetical protein